MRNCGGGRPTGRRRSRCPTSRADDLVAARALSAIAAWMALTWRGQLQQREQVLVLGASSAVGQVAVHAARILGALAGRSPPHGRAGPRVQISPHGGQQKSALIGKAEFKRILFGSEATGGFEPPIRVLQTLALTTWPRRHLERETGFEPATFSLARRRSTPEPLPRVFTRAGARAPAPMLYLMRRDAVKRHVCRRYPRPLWTTRRRAAVKRPPAPGAPRILARLGRRERLPGVRTHEH